MLKRIFDFTIALVALIVLAPLLIPVCFLVWIQDFHSPFYIAPRVGVDENLFKMFKLRSMIVNADKSGVDSTSSQDKRITKVGHFIRKCKLDEISQLINVFLGDMSLVGPRPNVKRETDLYTHVEKKLLTVRPGITDFASIVFADEGDILKDSVDPDLDYNQLIRPWKSRLALFNIEHSGLFLDFKILVLTATAIISRERALRGLCKILNDLKAPSELIQVASRKTKLISTAPPGSDKIVTTRENLFT